MVIVSLLCISINVLPLCSVKFMLRGEKEKLDFVTAYSEYSFRYWLVQNKLKTQVITEMLVSRVTRKIVVFLEIRDCILAQFPVPGPRFGNDRDRDRDWGLLFGIGIGIAFSLTPGSGSGSRVFETSGSGSGSRPQIRSGIPHRDPKSGSRTNTSCACA